MVGKKRPRILEDALREIAKSKKRFFSLFLLSALAVAFLAGLRTAAPDMEHTADLYFKAHDLMDIRLLSTVGFDEDAVDALRDYEGVKEAEGMKSLDAIMGSDTVSLISMPKTIGTLSLTAGRLPNVPGECVTEEKLLTKYGLKIGDTLQVTPDESQKDALTTNSYRIVGTADSPGYISLHRGASSIGNGSITAFIYIPEENFTWDYDTTIYLTLTEAVGKTAYTDEYEDLTADFCDELKPFGEELVQERYERLLADGNSKLADARKELQDAEEESDNKLADAWTTLQNSRQDLDDGWAMYEKNREQGLPYFTLHKMLTDGEREYAEGLREYEKGKREADRKLTAAKEELKDAEDKLKDLEDAKCYVLDRTANAGYVEYRDDARRMGNLAQVFPLIFFLVAALSSLTTATRMVEEHRSEIGTLKAMGYSGAAISLKYIGYTFFASISGGIFGAILGCLTIPQVIFSAWGMMYTLPPLSYLWQPVICILSIAGAILATTLTAFIACVATLQATPAILMRPKAPKPGKRVWLERIPFIWNRLQFTNKVTVRNLFRYHQRFFMTVIGIAGCTGLLVTGFGLHDSIFSILTKQFDEISVYDATVGLAEDITPEELNDLKTFVSESGDISNQLTVYEQTSDIYADDGMIDGVYLMAMDDPTAFADFYHLRHRLSGKLVTLSDDGVVITEKLATKLHVKVGDTITCTIAGDRRVDVPITDICENYCYHYVYMTKAYYGTLSSEVPQDNTMMLTYFDNTESNSDRLSTKLMALPGVTAYSRIATIKDSFTKSMNAINYAVIIIICSAAALAFVVLFNLTNINITERKRELATLKVLGFEERETADYVFRETTFLTFLGTIAGLFVGRFLHAWLITTVEVSYVMFGREVFAPSYVYAALLTIAFSLMVNWMARYSIAEIDMVESLKSVE